MTEALLTARPTMSSTRPVVELCDVVMRFDDKQVLDHARCSAAQVAHRARESGITLAGANQ